METSQANGTFFTASITGRRISLALVQLVEGQTSILVADSRQPAVEVMCMINRLNPGDDPKTTNITFGDGKQQALNGLMSFTEFIERGTSEELSLNEGAGLGNRYGNLTTSHTLLWQKPPSGASMHSLLFAEGESGYTSPDPGAEFSGFAIACTIDAHWKQSSMKHNVSAHLITSQLDKNDKMEHSETPIVMAVDWAEKLSGLWLDTRAFAEEKLSVIFAVPSFLAIGISDAVATPKKCVKDGASWKLMQKVPETTSNCLNDQQYRQMSQYINDTGIDKEYSDIVFSTVTNWTEPHNLTQLIVHGYAQGYGYNRLEIPVQLSLVILITYCLVVFVYIIFTLITGQTASSWDSVSELLLLGVQSKTPSHLNGTSVGIDTLATFREPISIRVNESDSVELVFNNDTSLKKRHLRNVVPNMAY